MVDNYTRIKFEKIFEITDVITLFYAEISKQFKYDGESHNFWEMVYVDKGEVICTADTNRFTLKNGEITFHKPNEFHNLEGDGIHTPNVSIITFECLNNEMNYLSGKIFKLTAKERLFLSMIFEEGLSCYEMFEKNNPLIQKMTQKENAPCGSSQMTKNLLEIFLILLYRKKSSATKSERKNYIIGGVDVPLQVKKIIDFMNDKLYERITVKEISEYIHQSESYTKKLFSQYYKGGLIHFYNSLKIKEARKLIREGDLSITQISELLCFDNPQYFSRCFSKFTDMSPMQYKKTIICKH